MGGTLEYRVRLAETRADQTWQTRKCEEGEERERLESAGG